MKVPAFFYGSYMDPDVLRRFGAEPGTPERATLWGWRLAFTPHANIVQDKVTAVEGVVYGFSHDELDRLYGPDGYVTTYRPVPVTVEVGGEPRPAMTFVEDARPSRPDGNYVEAFITICRKVDLPAQYVASVEEEAQRAAALSPA